MSQRAALFKTERDEVLTLVRLVIGIVMFAHGAQKLLGWFGGHGPSWTMEKWTAWFGFHPVVTGSVILAEFVASLALMVGFCSRVMAVVTLVIMVGACYVVHFKWGFYMNWYGEPGRGEGFEYHLILASLCVVIAAKGSGRWSVDRMLHGS